MAKKKSGHRKQPPKARAPKIKKPAHAPAATHAPAPIPATPTIQEVTMPVTLPDGQRLELTLQIHVAVKTLTAGSNARDGLSARVDILELDSTVRLDLDTADEDDVESDQPARRRGVDDENALRLAPVTGGLSLDHGGRRGTIGIVVKAQTNTDQFLLTASHVVGHTTGTDEVEIGRELDGQIQPSTVKGNVRISDYPRTDSALIELQDAHPSTLASTRIREHANKDKVVAKFMPPERDMRVIHSGIRTGGLVTGVIEEPSATATIMQNNALTSTPFTPFGLIKIKPDTADPQNQPFAIPGDSGGAVICQIPDTDPLQYAMVGLLIAVDDAGFGYAHRMTGPIGLEQLLGIALS